ncbi:MAG TPA: HAMP domain-containing protein [Chloroflexi bacterium]|nr:HAMP domain-containing protein [Chloroflexota bacterium]
MFKSVRSRLIASYLLVVLLAMGIATPLVWSALDRAFLDVLRENLLAQAQRVAQTVEAAGVDPLAADFQFAPYAQAANVLPGYHARVIDAEGVVILGPPLTDVPTTTTSLWLDSPAYDELVSNLGISPSRARGEPVPTADLPSRAEIQHALNGVPSTEVRSYTGSPNRRILYAAYPVRSPGGNVISVVYIASPLPRLTLSLLPDYLGPQILGGAALALLLSGLVGLALARQITRPLRQLTAAASRLAQGQPVPPIPLPSTTELHSLGTAFNRMNAHLTTAHQALSAQAAQREAILNSLSDAVLAADVTGQIILANPAASELLDTLPQPLQDVIQHTLATGEPHTAELAARGQIIQVLTAPLRDEQDHISGVVAVGHDVTAYRQLDRLRTDFVSDVSHELRTPLTAIKGFIETLQDGAADDSAVRDRFLNTIALETERLIRLTSDLLLLTRADAGQLTLRLVPTDLTAVVQRAASSLEGRRQENRLSLTIHAPDQLPPVHADADRIHQVLVNLLDNAVRATPAGGRVAITLDHTSAHVSCTIADTGFGIPPDEIPHLFERFYRGDPSRARTAGYQSPGPPSQGAGLGLSIAKAIVEAHGGRLWAENEPDGGAAFTFTLPCLPNSDHNLPPI